jgi:phosphatidylglycerol:prolipoprotein diacylglycerol transferase
VAPYINILGFSVPAYGLTILAGSFAAILISLLFPCKPGCSRQDIFFSSVYAGIGVFIGAKALYLFVNAAAFIELIRRGDVDLKFIYAAASSGFVFYGGLIGGVAGVLLYARIYRLPAWDHVEALMPAVPLLHSFGRAGCFLAGCCYGVPWERPLGVSFPRNSFAPPETPLFPVQVFESGFNLLLFALLFVYSRKPRARGRILGLYVACYSGARFVLEFFRNDYRGSGWVFSVSQWISLALFPAALFLLLKKHPPGKTGGVDTAPVVGAVTAAALTEAAADQWEV